MLRKNIKSKIEDIKEYPTSIILIASNILIIFSFLFFKWNPLDVLFAYWVESIVIVIFSLFKILKAKRINKEPIIIEYISNNRKTGLSKIESSKKNILLFFYSNLHCTYYRILFFNKF